MHLWGRRNPPRNSSQRLPRPKTRLRWKAIDLARLDQDEPLAAQGKFDVLIHKLTDDVHHAHAAMCDAASSNLQAAAKKRLRALCDYQTSMRVPLVDNPDMVANVVSRAVTCRLLETLHDLPVGTLRLMAPRFFIADPSIPASSSVTGHCPDTSELRAKLALAPFTYPLICKPVAACGGKGGQLSGPHCLTVVLKEEGLKEVPYHSPTIFQEYVNHDGMLLKVYVVGGEIRVFARKSLPNLPDTSILSKKPSVPGVVIFNSQNPYPTSRELLGDDHMDPSEKTDCPNIDSVPSESLGHALRITARKLQRVFGLNIFGFDAVVISRTSQLMVIDVNYFPSYKELQSELPLLLSKYFTHLCRSSE